MRMHSRLLHQALQKEEAKAIVIEVEDDPEEPGENEEFYAANFEVLGQEDEDEGEEMISEDGVSSLGNSDEAHDEEPSPYYTQHNSALCIPKLSIMIISMTTLSILILSIKGFCDIQRNDTQHNNTLPLF